MKPCSHFGMNLIPEHVEDISAFLFDEALTLYPGLEDACPSIVEYCNGVDDPQTASLEQINHCVMSRQAEEGTTFHEYLEDVITNGSSDVHLAREDLYSAANVYVEKFLPYLSENGVDISGVEVALGSRLHGICGMVDCIFESSKGHGYIIADYKVSETLRECMDTMLQGRTPRATEDSLAEDGPFHMIRGIRVNAMLFSSKCFEYAVQLAIYRHLLKLNVHDEVSPYVYLLLFHPILESEFRVIEIDVRIPVKNPKSGETESVEVFVERLFMHRISEFNTLCGVE